MEQLDSLVLDLALILVVAGFVTIIFRKIKQPVVLGYIVAGFLISPNFEWLPTVIDIQDIETWASIGIVFLMFGIGLEFNLHKVVEVGGGAIITALVVIAGMITVGYSIGQAMGWSSMNSVFLGCMISMSSTMIVIKAYEELGLKRRSFAGIVIGALVIEDLAGIFMMIILTTISVSKNFSGSELFSELGMLLLLLIVMLCLGIFLIPSILKKVEKLLSDELLLFFALGTCLLMVVLSVFIGFSEALGAFLAGSILAGTTQAERIEHLVQPIKDLFGGIFFVSVGMMIVPSMLVTYWLQILIITVVVIFCQMLFSCIGCLASGQALKTAVRVGCSMCQVGEFSFILATLGSSLGVTDDFLYPIIVCVSVITAFTTPIFIKNGENVYLALKKILPQKLQDKIYHYTSQSKGVAVIDKDWKNFLIKKALKVLIGVAGMTTTYYLITSYMEPAILVPGEKDLGANIILALAALICMAPFIFIMCSRKGRDFLKLWYKTDFNKLPLIAIWLLTIFLSTVFVTIVMNRYLLMIPLIVDILVAVVLVVLMVRLPILSGNFRKLETRFFVNLNERIIARDMLERKTKSDQMWVDEKMHLIEYQLVETTGKEYIRDLIANKAFGCMIVSIFRNAEDLTNFPKADAELKPGDILTVIGSEEGIDAYTSLLKKEHRIKDPKNGKRTLKEYLYFQMFDDDIKPENQLMCCALKPLERGQYMCGRTVKDSRFIAKYGGYMIAIERQGIQILSPDKDERFQEGDIVWCLGTQTMVELLEKEELLML